MRSHTTRTKLPIERRARERRNADSTSVSCAIPVRRSGNDRRKKEVSEASFGTGSELTEEEITRAEAMRFCSTCGIYHEGRDCTRQE